MQRAVALGLTVAKPYGDDARYDVVVDPGWGKPLLKVQVRCTGCDVGCGFQVFACWGARHKAYTPADIDFLAAWVIPLDTWYIVPVHVLRSTRLAFFPHRPDSRARWERYKEAWHLLTAEG